MLPTFSLIALAAIVAGDLQAVLDQQRLDQQLPGVSAVVTQGERVVFAGASGLADLETGRAMTADTRLYAGSLSKILTAVLTLNLVEQDELALASTLREVGVDTGDKPPITIAQLLSHASGLQREGDFNYWFTAAFPDRAALAAYIKTAALRGPPGSALHYSSVGYAALGLVIERITGESFAAALENRVLAPLSLNATGVPGPTEGIATGYTPVGRIIPSQARPFAGVGRAVDGRHVREYHNASAMSPAFGIYTSARDFGRLARFLLGHGGDNVLSQPMRRRMGIRQVSGWGLGLKIGRLDGRPVSRHEGWFAAHRSHLLLDVGEDIGVVVLTNSDAAAPARIAEALLASVRAGQAESPAARLTGGLDH